MGRLFVEHRGGRFFYTCRSCDVYLTHKSEMISSRFQGASGKAYLFGRCWNVRWGVMENREMMTGSHLVRDVLCNFCDEKLGWMYELAYVPDQQYKEGKVILEKSLIKEVEGIDDEVIDLATDKTGSMRPHHEMAEEPMGAHRRRLQMKAIYELVHPKRQVKRRDSSRKREST